MVYTIVRNTNGTDAAGVLGFKEGTPAAEACLTTTVGRVNQVSMFVSSALVLLERISK